MPAVEERDPTFQWYEGRESLSVANFVPTGKTPDKDIAADLRRFSGASKRERARLIASKDSLLPVADPRDAATCEEAFSHGYAAAMREVALLLSRHVLATPEELHAAFPDLWRQVCQRQKDRPRHMVVERDVVPAPEVI